MAGHHSGRIVAAVFTREPDTLDLQRLDLRGLLRRDMAFEVHELATARLLYAMCNVFHIHTQHPGQRRPLLAGLSETLRLRPHRVYRC